MKTKHGILLAGITLLLICTFFEITSAKTWYVDDGGVDFTNIIGAYKPIIQSVNLSTYEIINGGGITVTVIAQSNAPIKFVSKILDGPNGCIYGGGSGVTFTNIGDDLWKYEWTDTFSMWAPSGTYTYSGISVENEGQLESDEWEPIDFNVSNTQQAYKPIIQSVNLSTYEIINGGGITVTVIAQSNAPIKFVSKILDGPNGCIYGGGSGVTFTNIGDDLWKYEWTDTFSVWAPSGTYTYSGISVENEGQLESDEWEPIDFNVSNIQQAYKPIIQSVNLSTYEIVNGGELTVTVIAKSNAPVNGISAILDGPNGCIYGGGSGVTFTNISNELWRYEWTDTFSMWAPSGTYTYSGISVRNEGQLESDEWVAISFDISHTFDTGPGTYPSISGTHTGIITPSHDINVSKLYTYPCSGTGGHTEYVKFENESWDITASWNGYKGDWHNISFDKTFTLIANERYNFTIKTGSYPRIHHTDALLTNNGWINCTEFINVNGKKCDDWIPAIRLE